VSAEEVALGLEQVGGRRSCGIRRRRRARLKTPGVGTPISMAWMMALRQLAWYLLSAGREEAVEQQVGEVGVFVEGGLDVSEEDGADDASAAPTSGRFRHVEVPSGVLFAARRSM